MRSKLAQVVIDNLKDISDGEERTLMTVGGFELTLEKHMFGLCTLIEAKNSEKHFGIVIEENDSELESKLCALYEKILGV